MTENNNPVLPRAEIGILGGTGLYRIDGLEVIRDIEIETPFGAPSDAFTIGRLEGRTVAFLSRHGRGHSLLPSDINYRANICAFKMLGVERILSVNSVGSLKEDIPPRDIVIPDQFYDRSRRRNTFFGEGAVGHVGMADPVCGEMIEALGEAGRELGLRIHTGGTYVCIEGPAFSTRAESEMHRAWGGDLIGMTCMPEARLAREAEMAYALVALASDYDCWRPAPAELDRHELLKEIIGNLTEATAHAVDLIRAAVERFGEIAEEPSPAHSALELAIWSNTEMISPEVADRLGVLVEKYL